MRIALVYTYTACMHLQNRFFELNRDLNCFFSASNMSPRTVSWLKRCSQTRLRRNSYHFLRCKGVRVIDFLPYSERLHSACDASERNQRNLRRLFGFPYKALPHFAQASHLSCGLETFRFPALVFSIDMNVCHGQLICVHRTYRG